MPLNKVTLHSKLVQILSNPSVTNNVETIAEALADAIEIYVKSGLVNVTVNVATIGSATAQTGSGTGTGNIT
ncbi:hypothetical protein DK150_550080 [Flavobacterium psychrophilum]|uniref:hypothetical protein n=1 Tax=Flavobacterium psychrophilum TaxID=96345 RepID=UPI000B7C323D|nr:hypothetical protein [Flavobacterium psychrophilum]SNA83420.1 hypothetical protein DK150_550080 [Flavobacterium psychrophilum]